VAGHTWTVVSRRVSIRAGRGYAILARLEAGILIFEDTRVDDRAEDSDGKSAAGTWRNALDPYTVKHLARFVARIDDEAAAHG
jgi:hypothetical protein